MRNSNSKLGVLVLVAGLFFLTSCGQQMHPFAANVQPLEGSFIIIQNNTQGIDAVDMAVYINGQYVQNLAPGASTVAIPMLPNQTYDVAGKSTDGIKMFPKSIDLAANEEVVVLLG